MSDSYLGGAKYFACFSRFLPVKGLFQIMECIVKSNPLSTPTTVLTPRSYSGVIRVKMFALKHCVFMEDIWNFNKWK